MATVESCGQSDLGDSPGEGRRTSYLPHGTVSTPDLGQGFWGLQIPLLLSSPLWLLGSLRSLRASEE